MSKKTVELILLGAFLVLAVLLYGSTAAYPQNVQGSTAAYVRFLAISLGVLCAFEIIFSFRRKSNSDLTAEATHSQTEKDARFSVGAKPKVFWLLFLLLMLYACIFPYLGFYVSSALFLPLTMFALGARSLVTIPLTTLGVLAFVYVVFERILEVYMPIGSLFE